MSRRMSRESSEDEAKIIEEREKALSQWVPKTGLGKRVRTGEITSMDELAKENRPILEPEIVDTLLQLEEKVVDVRKTTRVVRAGRKFSFRVAILVGNRNGYIGLGTAKDTEKWPAARKATKNAKLNLIKIARGCGSWECTCNTQHSVPFRVTGKNAAARVTLLPTPRGVGLVAGDNIKDVLRLAGITDVWCKVTGATSTKLNFIRATIDALGRTTKMKASNQIAKKMERE